MSGLSRILLMAVCAQVIGCGAAGRLERVQPAADDERPGSAYMIRGLLGGSWSRGLDELA